jgi:hypothetical protein
MPQPDKAATKINRIADNGRARRNDVSLVHLTFLRMTALFRVKNGRGSNHKPSSAVCLPIILIVPKDLRRQENFQRSNLQAI